MKERKREAALNAHTPEEIEAVRKEEECHAEKKRKQRAKYKRERLKRKEQAHSAPEQIEAELSIARVNQNKIVSTPSTSTGDEV